MDEVAKCDPMPKPRDKHYSYDENLNEPAKLID